MKAKIRQYVLDRLWQKALKRISRDNPRVIAITGTIGKTSAKEALALILEKAQYSVVKTQGNLATETGVPLSLLGYEEAPSTPLHWAGAAIKPVGRTKKERPYYVLEFSADKPGDIAFLSQQIPPDVAVITAITPAHMGAYPNFAALIKEKMTLANALKPDGYAVLNADDPTVAKNAPTSHPVIWYGIAKSGARKAGVWAHGISYTQRGIHCSISFVHGKSLDPMHRPTEIQVHTTLIGEHQLYPLLAAAAVAYRENVPVEAIRQGIEAYQVPNGRGRLIAGHKKTIIVDDSYNASPEAVKAGLRMLRNLAGKRRVVAIIGTMNELGAMSEEAHREVAAVAARCVDFFVPVGPFSEAMMEAAIAAGLPKMKILHFHSPEALMTHIDQVFEYHDLIYVKASQNGMRLERVVKLLMAHPEQAKDVLVRQGREWTGFLANRPHLNYRRKVKGKH